MNMERLIRECYDSTSDGKEEREARETMAEILRENGFYVADGKIELKEIAIEELGLIEPE